MLYVKMVLVMYFMSELLAPAGNFEALVAAISNGADAIYLGMNQFGARAYAANFDKDNLKDAIYYAHLRNVKIYVTMNTIVFENELEEMKKMIDFLYQANVDGIIIQDLAVFQYVTTAYPAMEAHCSTQMGIDDLEGTLLFKELGAKRVVLGRETPIEKIKEIKRIAQIPLEIFIHGALCVSYSGNCLMSGLIGYRSGNRGRCVGSCRKEYQLLDLTHQQTYSSFYLLSMKDLNTIDQINDLKQIDSLKIEGRMKEPYYVANVVDSYRKALDGTANQETKDKLVKTFHRTFTKGYLFGEDKENITNILKPNNFGYLIGKIKNKKQSLYELELTSTLRQNDIIRIDHQGQDINLTVAKLYDQHKNYIASADKCCYLQIQENLSIGDLVYKTKDIQFYNKLTTTYPKEFRRFKIQCKLYAYPNSPLILDAKCGTITFHYEGPMVEQATKTPTSYEMVYQQMNRLNDTVYELDSLDYHTLNAFIPAKTCNDLRRLMVDYFNQERTKRIRPAKSQPTPIKPITFKEQEPQLAIYASTQEQVDAAKECGISIIYYQDNVIKRNEATYYPTNEMILVGGYGGIHYYQNHNYLVSDYSLNVVNSEAVHLLHKLGVYRVTLSYEMNKKDITDLIQSYYEQNHGYPNLEMIVYGRAPLMVTKYCPLKKLKQCGKCRNTEYVIQDQYEQFPIQNHSDCTVTILNSKILNLIDEINDLKHIQVFRLAFTKENKTETKAIIQLFQNQLKQKNNTPLFRSDTDTRGHFKKEIL